MSEQHQGDLLRDEGMQRAVDHANREVTLWSVGAYSFLLQYARTWPRFPTERVVEYARRVGFPEAPDPRAWGGVVRSAVCRMILSPGGYEKSDNPRAHRRPVQVWVSNVYNEGQQ